MGLHRRVEPDPHRDLAGHRVAGRVPAPRESHRLDAPRRRILPRVRGVLRRLCGTWPRHRPRIIAFSRPHVLAQAHDLAARVRALDPPAPRLPGRPSPVATMGADRLDRGHRARGDGRPGGDRLLAIPGPASHPVQCGNPGERPCPRNRRSPAGRRAAPVPGRRHGRCRGAHRPVPALGRGRASADQVVRERGRRRVRRDLRHVGATANRGPAARSTPFLRSSSRR